METEFSWASAAARFMELGTQLGQSNYSDKFAA
jgi:hypothetical protein